MERTTAYCNKCCDERQHDVLRKAKTTWSELVDEEYRATIDGADVYEMIQCRGCETVGMRHLNWFSEDADEHGRPFTNTTYYPPATFRKEPRWLSDLRLALPIKDQTIHDVLQEIYTALRNGAPRLAVMGIRGLLEHVMIDKVGDQGRFDKNLDSFEDEGLVSKAQRAVLEPVLEAGHATMHRAFKPDRDDLVACMDVTENIIESIYINEIRAERLKRVPPRKKV